MISKIRNHWSFKGISSILIFNILFEVLVPLHLMSLTEGPTQPEFNSFTPVGTSDMVDLSSGDMSYNIPLLDVGGYPINLSYNSGVGMDQEATWVGLGWNVSIGQINREVRGIPDDFKGDEITYEDNMKDNLTVGANFVFKPGLFGFMDEPGKNGLPGNGVYDWGEETNFQGGALSYGLEVVYNSYNGLSISPSIGANASIGNIGSVGFNVKSGPDGLSVSPNISLHGSHTNKSMRTKTLGISYGVSLNSRQGLTTQTLSMSSDATDALGRRFKTNAGGTYTTQTVGAGGGSIGSSVSFVNNGYTPTKRVPMTTASFTVNAALGAEFFGGEGQGQVTAYYTNQYVKNSDKTRTSKAYGYNHTEKANVESVLDFNREKDGNFSVNSTNLPVTNYTYDIYSVQGQGVGGMFRPYRSQVGYVHDPLVLDGSLSGTLGLELSAGNLVHVGADGEISSTYSYSGRWDSGNDVKSRFTSDANVGIDYEEVYFKNTGDLARDRDFQNNFQTKLGGYQAQRIKLKGAKFNRKTDTYFEDKNGVSTSIPGKIRKSGRQLRNQAIMQLTKEEVLKGVGYGPLIRTSNQWETGAIALNGSAKSHHTAEIQVTRNDGARYVYGLPAYNTLKKEATFSIPKVQNLSSVANGLVSYSQTDASINNSADKTDKFYNSILTPAYAHTYLLTNVLSSDYSDISDNGPTEDDFGSYTKFTYTKNAGGSLYRWRVPYGSSGQNVGTHNEGLKSDPFDDQANYVYGEKEIIYIEKIETKTHVAVFHYTDRKDAHGVTGEHGGLSTEASQTLKKVSRIDLYALPEYKKYGTNAKPIKSVHFVYDYSLCKQIQNNDGSTLLTADELSNGGGKLTLKKVYFTYRGSKMGKYTGYEFDYGFNPNYDIKGYDVWGNYKPNTGGLANSADPTNSEFPFVTDVQTDADNYASAWSLNKITLPSGGEIQIHYESDDYAYVQNKEAMRMYKVLGVNSDSSLTQYSSNLYDIQDGEDDINKYLIVQIPENITSADFQAKYLSKLKNNLLYFRFLMNMTQAGGANGADPDANKFDFVTGYCKIVGVASNSSLSNTFAIELQQEEKEGRINPHHKAHPISKAGWNFGKKYLPKDVFSLNLDGASEDPVEIAQLLCAPQLINNLIEIFKGPNGVLCDTKIARNFVPSKSWIRLGEPSGKKLGGGLRVKEILMSDIWDSMNNNDPGYQQMNYGQLYEYTLEDKPLSKSSGVATYEPVGCKENPFVEPIYSKENRLLAPDEENYIEKPMGESFFPSPTVTYSRVKVSNRQAGLNPGKQVKKAHKTGSVVTEFYTSKDYPTLVDETRADPKEDKQNLLGNLLKINLKKQFAVTQGYVIHVNDMNGKQKAQRIFAEGQEEAISGVDYVYDGFSAQDPADPFSLTVVSQGKLNNKVKVIKPDGTVSDEILGVEYDVVNDFRENYTESVTVGVNGNLAGFILGIFPGLVPTLLPDFSRSVDKFNSVSVTKVINTYGILRETIAHDAGASVSTRNLAWDELTGEVLVTETVDEFNEKYYTLNYPAHWAYTAMGAASENLDIQGKVSGTGNVFNLQGVSNPSSYLIDGDEMYVERNGNLEMMWVRNVTGSGFGLLDKDGNILDQLTLTRFRIVRSGHRNLQAAGIMNVTLMKNPIEDGSLSLTDYLSFEATPDDAGANTWKIINAGAVEYSDDWEPPCECGLNISQGIYNPFRVNERGVWRTIRSHTYRTGRTASADPTPRKDGFFKKFSPFYTNTGGNWQIDNTNWTYVASATTFSPYGFELENVDALNRYSAAQYGYNNTLPLAVGANTRYQEIGFDGFEDYYYEGCTSKTHFGFRDEENKPSLTKEQSHSGKYSMRVAPQAKVSVTKPICGN